MLCSVQRARHNFAYLLPLVNVQHRHTFPLKVKQITIGYFYKAPNASVTFPISSLNSDVVCPMTRLGFFPTTLNRSAGIRTHISQKSCTRLGPLKDALPTELYLKSLTWKYFENFIPTSPCASSRNGSANDNSGP